MSAARWYPIAALALLLGLTPARADSPLFEPIYQVLTHPRCMNCHTKTQFPRQGDDRRRHEQLVMRGADNHGAPTLQCSACHQDHNAADGKVPGAPHWALAPLSMAWEELSSPQLCRVLKDTSLNGNKSLEQLYTHMAEDELVLWGWTPGGGRSTPPLDHPEFVVALRSWINAGAPCD